MTVRLWCFDDEGRWGRGLHQEARKRGHDSRLFKDPAEVDVGVSFMRMNHRSEVRSRDKRIMKVLAAKPGLVTIPDARSARLYDDKVAQSRELAQWMPETLVLESEDAARAALGSLGYPFISKALGGASSYNVRLVRDEAQAKTEIHKAFVTGGIGLKYGERQKGYLLWQRFLEGNAYDFRVTAIGRERLVLRRGNRDDVPFASGSGREMPIDHSKADPEAAEVLWAANLFFEQEGFNWCGTDWVRDHEGFRLLEVTTAWPLGLMGNHRFMSGKPCDPFWAAVMDEIEAGVFGECRG